MERHLKLPRRTLLLGLTSLAALAACGGPAAAAQIAVYKTPTCGCCGDWVSHLRQNGFEPQVTDMDDVAPVRTRYGVPAHLSSCHTAIIDGYAIEGHVPAADIRRLLAERPKAVGLSVPGMPAGSPGMEMPDGRVDAFETLLILDRTGATQVFARHGATP